MLCSESCTKKKQLIKMEYSTYLFTLLGVFCILRAQVAATTVDECPKPVVQKRTIIRSAISIQNGAQLIKKRTVESARNCYSACCENKECNVAVMHYKQQFSEEGEEIMTKICYLFDCGNPSVCEYEAHNRYAIIEVPKKKINNLNGMPTTQATKTPKKVISTTVPHTAAATETETTNSRVEMTTQSKGFATEKCPSGVPVSMCSGNPCEGKHCATDRTAVCKPSFCGGCFAKFYDSKGEEVKCDKKFTNLKNNQVEVAEVEYTETPSDSLPGPRSKKVKEESDPYYKSEKRDWIDGKDPGTLGNATTTKNQNDNDLIVDRMPNEKKVIVVNNSLMSIPLLIALIISILLIIGLIYRFKCARQGKPKKLPVDDGDYLINGMYL